MNSTDSADGIFNRRFLAYLTLYLLSMAMAYIGAITFMKVPEGNQRVVDTVLGFLLGTVISTLLVFWYGSSKSSQAKDAALVAQLPAPPAPPLLEGPSTASGSDSVTVTASTTAAAAPAGPISSRS